MYPTKEHIKHIGTIVRDSAHLEGIDKPRSAGWYLAKAYEIHQHRQDPISEQVCIRAFEHYTLEPMRDKISAPIREWIQSEINPNLNRTMYPPHMTPLFWTAFESQVYGNTDAPQHDPHRILIAATIQQTNSQLKFRHLFSRSLYDKQEVSQSEANAKLAAHAPNLIGELGDAQEVLLQQMHRIATNQQPQTSELSRATTKIDNLLLNLQTEIKDSTPGPWQYAPKIFLISTEAPQNKPIVLLALRSPNNHYNSEELRTIRANGQVIASAPGVLKQLAETSLAFTEATYRLQAHQPLVAFDKLHTAALVNHQLLSAARGDRINPLTVDPAPGTPQFNTWIDSNLAIIAAAQQMTPNPQQQSTAYLAAQQESGIYAGTLKAETSDSYLQLRSDDKLIAHWKGSFVEPLEIGRAYNINYNQSRATAKEIPAKDLTTPARDR